MAMATPAMFPIPTLKVGDIAGLVRVVVHPRGHGEAVPQPADLDEAQSQREEETRAQQGDDDDGNRLLAGWDPGPPDDVVQEFGDLLEQFHGP
jgi:hypothetical protein